MTNVLASRFRGPGLSPGWGKCIVLLGKTFYSHSSSLNLGVSMCTGNLMLVVALGWTLLFHPVGGRNTHSHFMLQKLAISVSLMGHLAHMQT